VSCVCKLVVVMLLSVPSLWSQNWSGILDPTRAMDWSHAGVQGGITRYTTVCATISPSGDSTGATDGAAINTALASVDCQGTSVSPKVVYLFAGTFYSNVMVATTSSYQVIRGAGPDKTTLTMLNYGSCANKADVCFGGVNGYSGGGSLGEGSAAWTGDVVGGSCSAGSYTYSDTTICIGAVTGNAPSLGQPIYLDQRNDSIGITLSETGTTVMATVTLAALTPIFTNGSTVQIGPEASNATMTGYDGIFTITGTGTNTFTYTAAPGLGSDPGGRFAAVDTGGIFNCDIFNTCINSNNTYIGRVCPDSLDAQCAAGEVSERSQAEMRIVTGISSNQLTLDTPIAMGNWRTPQAPDVYWTGAFPSEYTQYSGIEDMTVDMSSDTATANGVTDRGIVFAFSSNCWAKNVRTILSKDSHYSFFSCVHCSVVDSYQYGSQGQGTDSYAVDFNNSSSEDLVQNNIEQHVSPGVIAESGADSVWGYNYSFDNGNVSVGHLAGTLDIAHGVSSLILAEGNDSTQVGDDNIHGQGQVETWFRNRGRGQDTPVRVQSLNAGSASTGARAVNFVGNVLGTTGVTTTGYQLTSGNVGQANGYTYLLGLNAAGCPGGVGGQIGCGVPPDPVTVSSSLRWGNYDVYNGVVRFISGEVPTSGIAYINGNSVPSSHALPASFYLSAQPTFWTTPFGTPPWPAIGPDVTGGTAPDGVGGYTYSIPAQLCLANTAVDTNYQRSGSILSATANGTTATLTFSGDGTVGKFPLTTGSKSGSNTITITGLDADFDGMWELNQNGVTTSAGNTTVTFAATFTDSPPAAGTIAWNNVIKFNASACYPLSDPTTAATISGVKLSGVVIP
jgi:hypothetical protein